MDKTRRTLIHRLAAAGLLGPAAFPLLTRDALAMGKRPAAPGFHQVEGAVLLNRQPARAGDQVASGDTISTGSDGKAVFVVERDAFLLRANSRLEIAGDGATVRTLRLLTGKLLSVFGTGEKRIALPTATLGIRGTAGYAEAEAARSYFCTCYGTVTISPTADPASGETVTTAHHDAPRYIYAAGAPRLIVPAPVINHTDEELIMLEGLVGRLPPFYKGWGEYYGGY